MFGAAIWPPEPESWHKPALFYCRRALPGQDNLGRAEKPTVLINIDAYWDAKIQAVEAHASQFAPPSQGARPTLLNRERFFEDYALRFRAWGREIGCTYAEALVSLRQIEAQDITAI